MLLARWTGVRILEGVINYSERYGSLPRGEVTIDDFVHYQRSPWSFREDRVEKGRVSCWGGRERVRK